MPRKSAWYRSQPTPAQLVAVIDAFSAVTSTPPQLRRGRVSRGLVRWDLESVADLLACYEGDVDEVTLALDSAAGTVRLVVRPAVPRTRLVVRLGSLALVEAVHAGLDQDPVAQGRTEPTVFIGHGRNPMWRELADHLQDHHGMTVVTYESAVRAGVPNHAVLEELAARPRVALLVHSIEDVDADGIGHASENVVHETGMFQAILGTRRAIVLREEGCRSFANIEGLNELRFTKGRIVETFGEVVAVIRRELTSCR